MFDSKPKVQCIGRIKVGAPIGQDMMWAEWPVCKPPSSERENPDEYICEAEDPNMLFICTKTKNGWYCKADGYGFFRKDGGEYGNGDIHVSGADNIEILTPMHLEGILDLERFKFNNKYN